MCIPHVVRSCVAACRSCIGMLRCIFVVASYCVRLSPDQAPYFDLFIFNYYCSFGRLLYLTCTDVLNTQREFLAPAVATFVELCCFSPNGTSLAAIFSCYVYVALAVAVHLYVSFHIVSFSHIFRRRGVWQNTTYFCHGTCSLPLSTAHKLGHVVYRYYYKIIRSKVQL